MKRPQDMCAYSILHSRSTSRSNIFCEDSWTNINVKTNSGNASLICFCISRYHLPTISSLNIPRRRQGLHCVRSALPLGGKSVWNWREREDWHMHLLLGCFCICRLTSCKFSPWYSSEASSVHGACSTLLLRWKIRLELKGKRRLMHELIFCHVFSRFHTTSFPQLSTLTFSEALELHLTFVYLFY